MALHKYIPQRTQYYNEIIANLKDKGFTTNDNDCMSSESNF